MDIPSGAIVPKILFWDVETSPIVAAVWGLYDQNIQPSFILEDWYMISAAWKFLGENVKAVGVSSQNPKNDYEVIRKMHEVLSSADIIVGHNGDAFDLKKFNARSLFHEFEPIPQKPSVDTLKVARKNFKITSNKLDFLGEFLGVGRKMDTPKGLWLQAMKGDREALSTMIAYNKQDVLLLEDVYLKLRPYMNTHPNINAYHPFPVVLCPKCGSHDTVRRGRRLAGKKLKQQYQCKSCGGYHSE